MDVTVTYLEMFGPPTYPEPAFPPGSEVRLCARPTARFYRFLYDGVGSEWLWTDRRRISDNELLRLITVPEIAVHVLYVDGCPAGYCELRHTGDESKLEYFGLMPEFIGRGLGRAWLEWTVHQLWATGPRRVWVHTCTLDHPRALPLYERCGFVPYRSETVVSDR